MFVVFVVETQLSVLLMLKDRHITVYSGTYDTLCTSVASVATQHCSSQSVATEANQSLKRHSLCLENATLSTARTLYLPRKSTNWVSV